MKWYEIKINAHLSILESLYNFLWTYVNGLAIKKSDKGFIVKAFIFSSSPDHIFKKIKKFLHIQTKGLRIEYPDASLICTNLSSNNDFIIVPSPATYIPPFGIPLLIQRGRAFGIGSHPCTIYCLEALKTIADIYPLNYFKTKILDAGTGTGILSIAAGKLGATNITGVDINAEFIKEAKENILLNGLYGVIDLFHCPVEDIQGQFNLIFANLYGSLLQKISSLLARLLISDGWLIVGGINLLQSKIVVSSFESYGLREFNHYSDEEWYVAILKK